jgi:hypothetical protein
VVLTAAIVRAQTAAASTQASLCVEVLPLQQSVELGKPAQWAVAAWTTGGDVPDATIRLQANPASAGTARFSFGCGSSDGTSSCDLGAVDANSAKRQLQAQVTVPLTAVSVSSVALTVTGSAARLPTDPAATASVVVLAPATPVAATVSLPAVPPLGVAAPTPALSPAGNVSGLLPTLDPGSSPSPGSSAAPDPGSLAVGGGSPVADTSAIGGGDSTMGAQVLGLGALVLACVLAVTRVSVRRPARAGATAAAEPAAPSGAAAEAPQDAEEVPTAAMSNDDVD